MKMCLVMDAENLCPEKQTCFNLFPCQETLSSRVKEQATSVRHLENEKLLGVFSHCVWRDH